MRAPWELVSARQTGLHVQRLLLCGALHGEPLHGGPSRRPATHYIFAPPEGPVGECQE